jgi:uncharacterized protein (TIGR02001 family)
MFNIHTQRHRKMRRISWGFGLVVLLAGPAAAQQTAGGVSEWLSGNVSVTSDYTFRGISQTLQQPALQGGIDINHPTGFYLGTWGSNVNFGEDLATGPRAQVELDAYGGFGGSLGGVADLDLGAVYYMYPGAGGRGYNFLEFGLGASRGVGPLGVGLSALYSPNFFAESGTGVYYGATVDIPVSVFTFSGSLGRQLIEDNEAFGTPDYTDWGATASVGLWGLNLGGGVVGTSLNREQCFGGDNICRTRAVISLSREM